MKGSLVAKYIIEFIGTFFLVFVAVLTGNPIAIGAILTAMVYMGGYISGAHYNPAVTLAVLIRGQVTVKEAIGYWIVQLLAGLAAAALFYGMAHSAFIPTPGQGIDPTLVVISELLFTFALATVVLHVGTSDQIKNNYYYGIAIGLTVLAGAFTVGQISGAVFNPAISVGPFLIDIKEFSSHGAKALTYWAEYVISPLVGATLAAFVYNLTVGKIKK